MPLNEKSVSSFDEDDCAIPHWINLSFYKSSETVRYCNSSFLPSSKIRIKPKKRPPQQIASDEEKSQERSNDAHSLNLPGYTTEWSGDASADKYLKSLQDTDHIFENYLPNKKYTENPLSGDSNHGATTTTTSLVNSGKRSSVISSGSGAFNGKPSEKTGASR